MPRLGTSICARARMRMRDRLRGWGWGGGWASEALDSAEEGSRNLCSDQGLHPASAEQGAASALHVKFKPGADPLLERKCKPSRQPVFGMGLERL